MARRNSIVDKLSRYAARHVLQQRLPLRGSQPVISITFDDVLASAAHTGAQLLEQHGCRGTFYIAGGLTGQSEEGRATHTEQDILDLHAKGHEIGSHGWGHVDYAGLDRPSLQHDQQENLSFLRPHLSATTGINFAYPFGQYNLRTKRLTTKAHQSCRILGDGLHRGHADLNLLGCHRLYGAGRHTDQWQALLAELRPGDWLIVNTHEVEPDCGPYGCTPEDLDAFIRTAQQGHCLILPIRNAIEHYQAQR